MLVGSQRLLAGLSLVLFAAPTLALITNRDDSDIPATVKDAIIAGQSTPHFGSDDIFWSPTRLSAEQLGLLSEKGDQSSPPVVYDGKNNNIAPGPVPAAAVPVPRSNVIEPADRIKRSQVTREKLIARNARPKRRGTPQNSPTPQYVCDPPVLITGTVPYAIRQGFFYTGGPETIQYVFNDPTIKNLGDCMDRCAATPRCAFINYSSYYQDCELLSGTSQGTQDTPTYTFVRASRNVQCPAGDSGCCTAYRAA